MDKVAGLRPRGELAPCAPPDLADAKKDERDRLLLSVMMNSGLRARLDLEQPAPYRRCDAERGAIAARAVSARVEWKGIPKLTEI